MVRDSRNQAEIRRLGAASAVAAFAADRDDAEFCFFPADRDPKYRARAWAAAQVALGRVGAWDRDEWFQASELVSLPADRLGGLRRDTAGLMLLLAHSRGQQAAHTGDAPTRDGLLREAADWNRRAERTHPDPESCRAVWSRRGFLARLGGDAATAERFTHRANAVPESRQRP